MRTASDRRTVGLWLDHVGPIYAKLFVTSRSEDETHIARTKRVMTDSMRPSGFDARAMREGGVRRCARDVHGRRA